MSPFVWIPLFSALACSAFAAAILQMGFRQLPNRLAALLMLSAQWWAVCEVLWNVSADPASALFYQRLSFLGSTFLGPIALHGSLSFTVMEVRPLRRWLPAGYAIAAGFLPLALATDLMVAGMTPTPWGFGMRPGPAFPLWLGFTSVCVALTMAVWVWDRRERGASGRHSRYAWAPALVGLLFGLGAATDAVLPMFGIQLPRLGVLSLTAVGGLTLWYLERFGFSRLSPSAFAARILRTLPDGLALVNLNGGIRLANERLAAMIGCTVTQAEGRRIGAHVDASFLDPPRELREVQAELTPLGGRAFPVSISSAPLLDNTGSVMGVVLIVRDRREVTMLRDRLVTSDRMVALGQLAAGIAHEINNPLAYVRANLQQMRREWHRVARRLGPEEPEAPSASDALSVSEWEDMIGETLDGVDRAATIIRDVKAFSHAGPGAQLAADLNELLDQVLRVAAPQLAQRVRVETSYGRLPPVPCSAQRLQQLFLNLVVNAAQAIEGEGTVRVTTERSGPSVIVTIEDDGRGIAPDVSDRIFEPFFTTKPVGEGSGLGLSISYEIVRSHHGEIWFDSVPDRGSAFRVRLPLERSGEAG